MNALLDRIARLYAPLGQRGLLMDGQDRFAPNHPTPCRSALARDPSRRTPPSHTSAHPQKLRHT
jgi:hypothetical protein